MTESAPDARTKVAKRPARRIGEKSRRGFAAMSPEQQRRIASEGGRASHESGKGHRFSSDEARAAGRIGGAISRRGPKKPPAATA
ncbi:KGG domain-containing protein [Hymenobacter ginsengisoli]|uniref:KGG domain-containing protein n=1 Tax=Hymenobacter sp. KCTC 23674 TaxID=2864219 RepID=UPI001C694EA7|nr:KGG domain-containing protein [Hymenobacter sp. KCTC 23674]